MFVFLILWALLMPSIVLAEEKETLCTILADRIMGDDVAYKAGVDVHGNAVVPADLNAAPIKVPSVIKIPLQVEMAKRLQILDDLGLETDAQIGLIEIHENGRVVYGGEDISSSVLSACGLPDENEVEEEPEIVTETPQSDNGQKGGDPIKSEPVKESKE